MYTFVKSFFTLLSCSWYFSVTPFPTWVWNGYGPDIFCDVENSVLWLILDFLKVMWFGSRGTFKPGGNTSQEAICIRWDHWQYTTQEAHLVQLMLCQQKRQIDPFCKNLKTLKKFKVWIWKTLAVVVFLIRNWQLY